MEFRILGPLEVLGEGGALELGGQKQRALLALLLLDANRVVSTDRLIDALWDEEPTATAQKALQVYVSRLRKLLGKERLETRPSGYLLRLGDNDELDLSSFERLREEGRLREALALWRGSALADFQYLRFAQSETVRLEESRLACLENQVELDLAAGRHSELVGELDPLVREHPLRQRLREQLMLALYRSSRDAEALELYQDTRRMLVEELGIEPRRELRELQQAILRQDPALDLVAHTESSTEAARGVFVGREQELGELVRGLDDAFAGRGGLFLLVGEPGIGKSRLGDEILNRGRARGAEVLVGRCWEAGGAPAYWPWVQSLRSHLRSVEHEALRAQLGAAAPELAQILPELRDLFPDLEPVPSPESEGARFRLFDAVTSVLRRISDAQPLVLGLDDLHAADEPSLLLLQFVARELGASRILIVAAYRDVDPTPTDPLTATITDLLRQPLTHRIALTGLGESEVEQLIELTADVTAAPAVVAGIYEETEGNPLFVGEVVRLLATEGLLSGGREDVERLGVPQGVREVIGRRLGRLSEHCARVLTFASILGREFSLVGLESVARLPVDEVLNGLDEAMTERLVTEVPGSPGRLRFAHALIRDVLYEELTGARRIALHRAVAEALEQLYAADPGPHLAELAHHFFRAAPGGHVDKAAEYAARAGARAIALLAYEEAVRLYSLGLAALDSAAAPDELARCDLLLGIGDARARAGDLAEAKEAFLQAAERARALGNADRLAAAALGYGGRLPFSRAGADALLVPLLEEALGALGDGDSAARARLLARLAGAIRGDPGTAQRRASLVVEAREIARRVGNAHTQAFVLEATGVGVWDPTEAAQIGSELLAIGEQIGDLERVVLAHLFRFTGSLMLGDLQAADSDLEEMARAAERLRQPAQQAFLPLCGALRALIVGAFGEAETLMQETLERGREAHPWVERYVRLQRYVLRREQGRLDELEDVVIRSLGEPGAYPIWRCVLTDLYLRIGREAEAHVLFEDLARDEFASLPLDEEWSFGIALVAEVCAAFRDADRARTLSALLAPHSGVITLGAPEVSVGAVDRYLGLLSATLGRWQEAAGYFEAALALNERMGARPWLAHTQEDYARMLLARDEPGDRERAQELLGAALATYRELGMEGHSLVATS